MGVKELENKINVFNKRIQDILKDSNIIWKYIDNDYYNTIIDNITINVFKYHITIIDQYDNTYKINTNEELYNRIKSNKEIIKLNDIVVKVSYKEMKSLDLEIEPIDAHITIGNKIKKFRLYYNYKNNIYFGYKRDLEFEDIPHCKILEYKDYLKRQYINDYDLRPQSILYSYGYKVTGTTNEFRHKVLKFIIDEGIMYWTEIIEFLEWLISMRTMEQHCVYIWSSDIDWIRKYINGNIEKIEVKL